MAEPISEQILATLQTDLAGIVGDGGATYWYTVHKALRAPAFTSECLDESLGSDTAPGTIYTLVPDEEEPDRPAAMARVRLVDLPVDLVVAQRFMPADENPFNPPSPMRETIQRRLVRDAKRRLWADGKGGEVGGLAITTEIPIVDMSPETTFFEGWVAAFLHLRITYQYVETAP